MNNGNQNSNNSSSDVMSWAIVIICLVAFWPLGLILLLRKISFNAKKGSASNVNCQSGQTPPKTQQASSQYQQYAQPRQPYQTHRPYKAQQPFKPQYYQPPQQARPAAPQAQNTAPTASYTPSYNTQAPHGQQGSYSAQVKQPLKTTAVKKPKKSNEKKQAGKGLAAFLTVLGIIFSIIGVTFISSGVSDTVTAGMNSSIMGTFLVGVFFCLGGIISFLSRIGIMARVRRCAKYSAILGDREVLSVVEMSNSAGVSQKKLRKDLIEMAEYGYFGEAAYFDMGLDSLCLSSSAAELARKEANHSAQSVAEKPIGSENQYVAIINELHMLCGGTVDPSICAKIQRIEELTAKIFKIVEEKPEKAPQIRRFMNYYLPTTLKLLHSYETLEKQGVNGENIMSAKQDIERVLETLAAGYEQQLDNLFKSDMIDISADINVLENMMEQDGLTNEGNILKTSGGN